MKSAVETLNPTRVKLTVEIPYNEFKPSVDAAYRKIARQVRVQGFRPGKVPPRIIDQRFGRGAVLEEAVQEAIPTFYGAAVRENDVVPLGHPEVDVTELDDGVQLVFTAEVDVRPQIELPAYDQISVAIDDLVVSDEDVDQQLSGLRERFATLTAAARPADAGDYVSIDLTSTVDGQPVPGGDTSGLSYEIGSGTLMPGLDDALRGLSEGESATFDTELAVGEFAGRTAQVTATVKSVKVKEVPPLDDDFAQTASEFDTIEELRADVRARLERVKRFEQGAQARDRVLEALLAATEVPLPESAVHGELDWRRQTFEQQLTQAGLRLEDYLSAEERSREDLDREFADNAAQGVKAQLVLDAVADKEELTVDERDVSEHLARRALRSGTAPQEYARQLVESGQLAAVFAEVRRAKALAVVLDAATVTDASGRPVDLSALREDTPGTAATGSGPAADGSDADEVVEAETIEPVEVETTAETAGAGNGPGPPPAQPEVPAPPDVPAQSEVPAQPDDRADLTAGAAPDGGSAGPAGSNVASDAGSGSGAGASSPTVAREG